MRFCWYNVENLFLETVETDGDEWTSAENKPFKECRALAKHFATIGADIFLLAEVGGIQSLNNFNQTFLSNQYQVHHIRGNSERGIDLAALTRNDLPYQFEYRSNRETPLNFVYPHERPEKNHGQKRESHRFSRDVTELWISREGTPTLCVLLAHLKSQLDPQGIDHQGLLRREAEVKKLVEIYLDRQKNLPTLVCGDFNGLAAKPHPGKEFREIYERTELEDALEIMGHPTHERSTYSVFQRGREPRGIQLDYFFIPKSLRPNLQDARAERSTDGGSDHAALVVEFEFE